ncbi:glutathione S-transferase family protein [Primorskyibacter sp. 2E107]|uniref:glutathione S-transferase family protein n=1 Tax=Primorskyibacter sp. 2E107 TaxID=3403458 RepID=UPI003AF5761E
MLTLYHAPASRSTRIIQLLEALDARDAVEVRAVDVKRADGSGRIDPENPHPEGKVPLLVHDGVPIRESNAIMIHLCMLFPEAGMAPVQGTPDYGRFLSWMAYYGNVMEPVIVAAVSGDPGPMHQVSFRGPTEMAAVLITALEDQPYLMGERFSAADLLLASPFVWMRHFAPKQACVQAWIDRCMAHPSWQAAAAYDEGLVAA